MDFMKHILRWFRQPPHVADEYFREKMSQPLTAEGRAIVRAAYKIRHAHPTKTGPELICMVYWGS